MEKRRNKRYPKRLKVAYGDKGFTASSYTANISKTGAFVIANKLPPPGSRVHLQIFSDETWLPFEGEVRWQKIVPVQMRQLEPGGFGVRFLRPEEMVEMLLPHIKGERRFEVLYTTPEDLVRAHKQELSLGGVFVRTDVMAPRDAPVMLEVNLEFAGRTIEIPAKVLQCVAAGTTPGSASGLALVFDKKDAALASLAPYLPPTGSR